MMRRICAWSCAAVVGVVLSASVHAAVVDEVVATVDTEVILLSDLETEMAPLAQDLSANASSQEDLVREVDAATREVLDQAIEQKILYREAILAGAQLEEEILNERIEKIQSQYPSPDAFQKVLEEAGETMADFRERIRKQTIALSFGYQKRKQFETEAVITEAQAQAFYEQNRAEFGSGARVQVRRLFLGAGSDLTQRAAVRATLEGLRAEIEAGADFAELAKANSEGPEAEGGGLVGWVGPGDLVPVLEEAVLGLPQGALTPVIETDFGFQFLRVEERMDAGEQSFEQARTMIEPKLREQYAFDRYKSWMTELKKRSRVRVFL